MKPELKNLLGNFVWLLPLSALAVVWLTYPFPDPLAKRSVSLLPLNGPQRMNLQVASRAVNGFTLKPGEVFSFNARVGPRTSRRGYEAAPSYLEKDCPKTNGGGICLLSSCLYQLALEAGLPVLERTAHTRTIKTVSPGYDATVWYGMADLKFRNDSGAPLRIQSICSPNELTVELLGRKDQARKVKLARIENQRSPGRIEVQVYRELGDKSVLVSRDIYECGSEIRSLAR